MYFGDSFNDYLGVRHSQREITKRRRLDPLERRVRMIDAYLDAIDRIDDFGGNSIAKTISNTAGKAKDLVTKNTKSAKKFAEKKVKQAKKFAEKKINQAEKFVKKNPKKAVAIAGGVGAGAGAGGAALAMKGRDSWYRDLDYEDTVYNDIDIWKGNILGQLWESGVNKVRGRGFNTNEEHLQNQINEMQKKNSASKPPTPAKAPDAPKPAAPKPAAPKPAAPKPQAKPATPKPAGPAKPAAPKPPAGPKPPAPQKATDSWYRGYRDAEALLKRLKGRW